MIGIGAGFGFSEAPLSTRIGPSMGSTILSHEPEPVAFAHADILGTQMPSPEDTGTRGRDAAGEKLTVINVARAPARFRAFPDDAGIAL
jgi:hypothetical protein